MSSRILQAVADTLQAALGVPAGVGDMTGTLPPFISGWGSPADRETDRAVGGSDGSSGQIGVTFTAELTSVATDMCDDGVQVLTPRFQPARLHIAGLHVQLAFFDVRNAQIDRAVTLPDTDSHPAYCVALLDYHSHPIPVEVSP